MALLTNAQETLLAAIAQRKLELDKWEEAAQNTFKVARAQRRAALKPLVVKALADGIPKRQIHLRGLGFKQMGQMTNFFAPVSMHTIEGLDLVLTSDLPDFEAPSETADPSVSAIVETADASARSALTAGFRELNGIDPDGTAWNIGFREHMAEEGVWVAAPHSYQGLSAVAKLSIDEKYPRVLKTREETAAFKEGVRPARWNEQGE